MTLRELADMYEGRQYDNWNHTAAVMAILANVNRTKSSKTYELADFHPMMKRRGGTVIDARSIGVLKMFVPSENRKEGVK